MSVPQAAGSGQRTLDEADTTHTRPDRRQAGWGPTSCWPPSRRVAQLVWCLNVNDPWQGDCGGAAEHARDDQDPDVVV